MRFWMIALFSLTSAIWGIRYGVASTPEDLQYWRYAQQGDYNLVHKATLLDYSPDFDREMLKRFRLIYVFYKLGNYSDMLAILKNTDSYLNMKLIE